MQDELALSEAIAEYAAQAAGERVDPAKCIAVDRHAPCSARDRPCSGDRLRRRIEAGEVLQHFNPQHEGYRALKEKLAELRAIASPA